MIKENNKKKHYKTIVKAISKDDALSLTQILKEYDIKIDEPLTEHTKKTVITLVIEACKKNTVDWLISKKEFDINENRDDRGNTLLHNAARVGNISLLEFLLEKGARSDVVNLSKQSPLFFAVGGMSAGHQDCFKRLLKKLNTKAFLLRDNTNNNILHWIAGNNILLWDVVTDHMTKETKTKLLNDCNENGDTVLNIAVGQPFFSIYKKIVSHFKDNFDKADNNGRSPLYRAVVRYTQTSIAIEQQKKHNEYDFEIIRNKIQDEANKFSRLREQYENFNVNLEFSKTCKQYKEELTFAIKIKDSDKKINHLKLLINELTDRNNRHPVNIAFSKKEEQYKNNVQNLKLDLEKTKRKKELALNKMMAENKETLLIIKDLLNKNANIFITSTHGESLLFTTISQRVPAFREILLNHISQELGLSTLMSDCISSVENTETHWKNRRQALLDQINVVVDLEKPYDRFTNAEASQFIFILMTIIEWDCLEANERYCHYLDVKDNHQRSLKFNAYREVQRHALKLAFATKDLCQRYFSHKISKSLDEYVKGKIRVLASELLGRFCLDYEIMVIKKR